MYQSEWENLASLLSLGVAIVTGVLLWSGWIPRRWIDRIDSQFVKLSRTPALCFVLLPAVSFAVNIGMTLHRGIPLPFIHDEFSYLLAADTFAHGRLTNPTPPFWEHLETPQQLMMPTYMSKYPPGQGLALALGQVMTGLPIVGAWISTAAAVAAIYWMLLGYLPRPWALLGGIVAAIHPQLIDWSQNYWGGSVAVLGGALVLGAWGRLMISTSASASFIIAVGLIILANSRPFEGLVLCAPLGIALLFRRKNQWFKLLVPAGLLLLIGAGAMGYYNFRITGNAMRLPFAEYTAQYDYYPKLWFMPMRPLRVYRNGAMEYVHRNFEVGSYKAMRTVRGFFEMSEYRFQEIFLAQLKLAVLMIPLIAAIFVRKDRRLFWIWIAAGFFVVGLWSENFVLPHYQAPLVPVALLIIVIGWQKMNGWNWRGRAIGKILARATALGFLVGAGMVTVPPVDRDGMLVEQQSLVKLLPSLQTGRHLIFVSYSPLHSYHIEYVHNLADPVGSRIIWSRSFGVESDRAMARHFADRKPWLLYVGGKLDLQPYSAVESK